MTLQSNTTLQGGKYRIPQDDADVREENKGVVTDGKRQDGSATLTYRDNQPYNGGLYFVSDNSQSKVVNAVEN